MKKTWTPEKPLLTIAAAMFFLQALSAAEPNAPRKEELNEFATRLNLSGLQIQEVERFLKMIEGQARADRERCTGNAQALIAAAEQRQLMEERHLESILELEQIERYQDVKELRKRDWEYLHYREGLLLTASQCITVRAILDEFTRKRKIMGEEMKNRGDQGGGHGNKGPGGGRMGGGGMGPGMGGEGGMRGGMGGGPGGMGPGGPMREDMETVENEISKRIKEILTPDQKKMFKDVQRMIREKRGSFRDKFEPSGERRRMGPPR